jgi:hypothetical protein
MLEKKAIFDPTSNVSHDKPTLCAFKIDELFIFLHLKCVFSQNLINTLLIISQ